MLILFLKSYYSIILTIFVSGFAIFTLGTYCLLRRFWIRSNHPIVIQRNIIQKEIASFDLPQDVSAIAGDNVIATQLDLARAYIETNQKHQAMIILDMIVQQGSITQQEEAKELMNFL